MSECALLPTVRTYIIPIMKMLKPYLNNEYFLDNSTKCLYTAVVVMTLYLGKYSLRHIKTCDVDNVRKRNKDIMDKVKSTNPNSTFNYSRDIAKDCISSIFDKNIKTRYLFYIMMTNSQVPKVQEKNDKAADTILFPGHVCVLERVPGTNSSTTKYYVYQSYINNYDINGHFDRNNGSFSISEDNLRIVFNGIYNLYDQGVWTEETTRAYKMLTHVDSADFEGRYFKDNSFFCYRKVPISTCMTRLRGIVKIAVSPTNAELDAATKDDLKKLLTTLQASEPKRTRQPQLLQQPQEPQAAPKPPQAPKKLKTPRQPKTPKQTKQRIHPSNVIM